jgi:hypothetical protein
MNYHSLVKIHFKRKKERQILERNHSLSLHHICTGPDLVLSQFPLQRSGELCDLSIGLDLLFVVWESLNATMTEL